MDVRPANRKLEARPVSFHAVDVALAVHVLARAVIDRLVLVTGRIKPTIGLKLVGMNRATRLDVFLNDRLQGLFTALSE